MGDSNMRIRQMDGLRAVAALAVVMIHVSAGRMNPVGVSCNQAARFAVPLFIMLSSYGHMHSWLQHSGQSAVQTAKRRLKRVLPAYLVWSVLYLAVDAVFGGYVRLFEGLEDERMRLRAADIQDLQSRLLRALLGRRETDLSQLPEGCVLVTRELTPSMAVGLDRERVAAILTETGGSTSHAAILARALGIPAVLSIYFDLFSSFMQAFIFCMLTMLYIANAAEADG